MANSSYAFTQGSGTNARSTTDGTSKHSANVVVEYQDGSSEPVPVSSSTPFPVLEANSAAIKAALETLDNAISGSEMQVDIVSSALPTGASTSANQDTANTALAAIQAAVEILDNAISGSEMQVDIVSTVLPTGASTAANQTTGNNSLSSIDSTLSAGIAAEGTALGSGVLLQGDDGTDRKNLSVDPSTGDLQVDITNTVAVDGSAVTQPVSAASLPLPTGAATAANQLPDGHNVTVDNAAGAAAVNIQDGGNSITVDGTITANLGATDNAVLDAIQAATEATQTAVEGTLTVTGGGGGTEYTEDVATANPIVGTATLMERDDALTTVTPVEGDWIGLRGTAEGALWTQDFNSDAIYSELVTANATLSGTLDVDGSSVIAELSAVDNAVLDTIAGDTTSLDSKVTACNTGAVVISSGTITANLSATDNAVLDVIAADTTSLDSKVTACNTGAVVLAAGTANIGDVDVLTQPARDRLTDNVGVAMQTDVLLNDTTALTPKFAIINASSSGDNTIVAAVVGKKIRVISYDFVCAGDVDVRWEDGAGGTALSGVQSFAANGGKVKNFNPLGHLETSINTLLNLELGSAVQVSGELTYVEV